MRRDDPEVSGHAVPTLHLHQVAHHHLLRVDLHLLSFSHHKGLLRGSCAHLYPDLPLAPVSPLTSNPIKEKDKPGTLRNKIGPSVENWRVFSAQASFSEHKELRRAKPDSSRNLTPQPTAQPPAIYLRHHVLEGIHDLGALGLLVVGEAASDDDHSCQHHAQIKLVRTKALRDLTFPSPRGTAATQGESLVAPLFVSESESSGRKCGRKSPPTPPPNLLIPSRLRPEGMGKS